MASITIRNLNDDVKKRLRKQAAENGRSMEEEAREILDRETAALTPARLIPKTGLDLIRGIREVVEKYGGVDLELPSRNSARPVNLFEGAAGFRAETPPKSRRKRKK
jgi:plasmid stability protein